MKHLLWLILLPCFLSSCVVDGDREEPDADETSVIRVGDRLPSFTVDVIDGVSRTLFNSNDLQGPVVIVFFNTGCSDCQRELPRLNDFYLRHRNDPGFQMVAIAREESQESIAGYWSAHQLSIPYSPQSDRRVYNFFATLTIPRVYFCTSDGLVTWMGVEKFDLPE